MKKLLAVLAGMALVACQPADETSEPAAAEPAAEPALEAAATVDALGAVLDARPEEARARYPYRHPRETLEFFGVEPGMTVVELSLIHISEPTRPILVSRMPSSA